MKKILFICVCMTLLSAQTLPVFAQPFKLSDNTFKQGQFLPLWDIHFEVGKADLQVKPKPQLDSLADFLTQHKNLKTEIGVHTDFRGDDELNLKLSQGRATALKNYLVSRGVDSSNLTAIGFGETKPMIEYEDFTKLDAHQCFYYGRTNRRVTIVIIDVLIN